MNGQGCWQFHISARTDDASHRPFHGEVLSNGTYKVQCIRGEFTAWTFRKDQREWLNKFQVWSPIWPVMEEFSDGHGHCSAEEALQAAGPHQFKIAVDSGEAIVLFLINDAYHDNKGGVSLSLRKVCD